MPLFWNLRLYKGLRFFVFNLFKTQNGTNTCCNCGIQAAHNQQDIYIFVE